MNLLIDGDLLAYQASVPQTIWKVGGYLFKTKKDAMTFYDTYNTDHRWKLTKKMINPYTNSVKRQLDRMLIEIQLSMFNLFREDFSEIIFIKGDKLNYRFKYANTIKYKQHRPTQKPPMLQVALDHLKTNYTTVLAHECESDDMLGIWSTAHGGIIVSKDKDMLTIPGFLYNNYKGDFRYVTEEDADKAFYTQILTGDRADNIMGLPGVGDVKARKILEGATNKKDMLYRVLAAFESRLGLRSLRARDMVDELGKLLYIQRVPNEIWSVEGVLYGTK